MAIAVIAHTGQGSANGTSVTTGTIDTTGATLLVLAMSSGAGSSTSFIQDSKSNTWTLGSSISAGVAPFVELWYDATPVVGTGHTFSRTTQTSSAPGICVLAVSGTDGSAQDRTSTGSANPGTAVQPGSVTPTTANQIVITGVAGNGLPTWTIDSGFTIADQVPGGTPWAVGLAYLIQTTATAVNPTWSSGNMVLATGIGTFKASTGGDTSTTQQRMVAAQSLIESSGVIGLRWR